MHVEVAARSPPAPSVGPVTDHPARVYLHIGLPKSGTTFLQTSLADNRSALRSREGVLVPAGDQGLMFRAALDVRGNHRAWGQRRTDVAGAWDQVCLAARRHHGTTVVSHELLAAAPSHRIAAAMTTLSGLEVHVVVTVRDPASQAVAEWQEGVKHGRTLSFREFRRRVLGGDESDEYARRFAEAQDLPRVLTRWSAAVPAERVHVVCTPPRGTDPRELWRLFGSVVGFDGDAHDVAGRANASLGVVEIDLLRRVNVALAGRLAAPQYGTLMKRYFAEQVLSEHVSDRPTVPGALYDELLHVGRQWTKEVERAGYCVHGNLEHLLPVRPDEPGLHPDDVDRRAELATATSVLAEVLVDLQRSRARVADLEAEKRTLQKKRKALKRRLAEMLGD